tara:strand:- start:9842 stop:12655 length:2814 start_codon:yes stop_codon:yes gene_type:complete
MKQESLIIEESANITDEAVECLGLKFENDEARRAHFTQLLAEKLKDPEFRKIEGFPIGTDEAILELSDPPFYTACPNPWLNEFISLWESQKETSDEDYHREPFAADVSEGKNDPIYNAHSYHTKVPHKAIMRYILHYTEPGDIVFDGFCGTGMTGVAANMCGNKNAVESLGYKVNEFGDIFQEEKGINGEVSWKRFSKLGVRKAVLNDLSPAATFIASNYNRPVSREQFIHNANSIVNEVEKELGWMYETKHENDELGKINFTLWSDVFICSECNSEIIFWDTAIDSSKGSVKDTFCCSSCNAALSKRGLEKKWVTTVDQYTGKPLKQVCQYPVLINYTFGGKRFEKRPDEFDLEIIAKSQEYKSSYWVPRVEIPQGDKTGEPVRLGYNHVHHLYTNRNLSALSHFRKKVTDNSDNCPHLGLWFTSSQVWGTRQNRLLTSNYFKKRGGVIGQTLQGTLYVSSLSIETNLIERFRLRITSVPYSVDTRSSLVNNSSMTNLVNLPENSLDYIFIDPPFGSNLMYSELNILWESWLNVRTDNKMEAIENKTQKKQPNEYRAIMARAFKQAYKSLKPGKWLTVEFSNTKAIIWNNIQTSIAEAGFIVANVSALNKTHNGFNAVTNPTSVKQDLVITAYKPEKNLRPANILATENSELVWHFLQSHLKHLPVAKVKDNELVHIPERDPRILYDQVVSYFVRNGTSIPISGKEFQVQIREKFNERDGMFFTSEQLPEYDRQRILLGRARQLEMFVNDEASIIQWMGYLLKNKPMITSEIHPLFLNQLNGWKRTEPQIELSTLLEQNFIKYDGKEEVPNQIHTYLSTNFKDMRGLAKDDPALVAKAKDRWYVPDPNKAGDLEKVRLRALLREFEVYKTEKKKIKQPRAEALRAGFNHCWESQNLQTILDISAKIPPAVLQEDEKLLMFYDNAVTLTSNTDDDWD